MRPDRGAIIVDIFARAGVMQAAVARGDGETADRVRREVHDLVDAYLDRATCDIQDALAAMRG